MDKDWALACVGQGWSILINKLYEAKPDYVEVIDVKEKFGTLRFYVGSAPDWYLDLIGLYEDQSGKLCENCGKFGEIRGDLSWILTLCEDCYNQRKAK